MFKIDHQDDSGRSIKIDSVNNPIDDINIRSKNNITNNIVDLDVDSEDLGLNFITNETKRKPQEFIPDSNSSIQESEEVEEYDNNNQNFMYENEEDQEEEEEILSHEEIQQQKAYYLSQLKRLEQKGSYASRKLGIEHPLNIIKGEYLRIKKEKEIDNGIKFCRTGLMFCVSTIEMFNKKYDPFDVDLDGWSNIIMAEKEQYDDVFEELYEKYHSKMAMAPELKLIAMVAGSAMMFSLQKSMANKQLNKNGMFGSMMNSFMGSGTPQKSTGMKGPSIDTESLLDKLNNDSMSDTSSVTSEISEKTTIPVVIPKKRGRPKRI